MSALPTPDDDRTVVAPAAARTSAAVGGANALPPGTKLGEFEIVGLVGEGGFGIVYLAQDSVLERRVALKEYLPASLASRGAGLNVNVTSTRHDETFQIGLRSFLNEARLLAQFDHSALVKVYRFWEANGTAYMVMPYYEGATLKQALQRDGPPDEAQLTALLSQVLDALEVLHRVNCLHRDIAPDNILMLAGGHPVLLDFGAARRVIGDRTQALTVILKPGFAPIEQYAETPSLRQGPWTDVYALAGVAHLAITGAAPAPSVARTLTDPMVPLEQAAAGRYSAAFLRAIDRALAVKPEDRPQSVAEFRALLGLGHVAKTSAAFNEARTIVAPPARKPGGVPAVAVGGALIALVTALAIGVFVFGDRPTAPAPIAVTSVPVPPAAPSSRAEGREPPALPEPPAVATTSPPAEAPAETVGAPPPPDRAVRREPAATPARVPVRERPTPAPIPVTPPPAPAALNPLAGIAAAALEDGEKCLRAKQYDCAIANANGALRAEPASPRAKRLKGEAEEAQRRALSEIKID